MALNFPYTYISCPCSDPARRALASKRTSREIDIDEALEQEDSTFDPKHPRSAFSLHPPEHLFYCEDCQDLKCPRCVVEEIVCIYCPQCLFDAVPSSVKADGNRCGRNCFMCPICFSQLGTSSLAGSKQLERPYVLNCQYCMWTSLDSGIDFANPSGLRQQLEKRDRDGRDGSKNVSSSARVGAYNDISRARGASALSKEYTNGRNGANSDDARTSSEPTKVLDHQARFAALKSFYKEQLLASDANAATSTLDFSSPSSLTRLMNLYSSGTGSLLQRQKQKTTIMREALTTNEGLELRKDQLEDEVQHFEYDDVPTQEQIAFQYPAPIGNPAARKASELKPMPTQLRTKRSKRCAACKHILVKPELKVTSTRYRIKLMALNYVPYMSLKPVPVSGGLLPAGPDGDPRVTLQPGRPSQWILTLRNPLFEHVDVSLGSPSIIPGRYGHKVTILCPQFSIGKNGDVWDDALSQSQTLVKSDTQVSLGLGAEQIAGKVYDRGQNWTSVVVEIVPASIVKTMDETLLQDEDVVEIPIRVRLDWKITDEQALRDASSARKDTEDEADDGQRELSYWMVLGIGRTAQLSRVS